MAIVVCPECNNYVSQYAETCPKCGFPIKSFMTDQGLFDTKKLMICPKCAHTYAGFGNDSDPIYIKCKFCSTNIVQTDLEWLTYSKIYYENNYNILEEKLANQYGNNQFSQEAYEHRLAMIQQENKDQNKRNIQVDQVPQKPQIICPYCNSTNIKKLSFTKKAISIGGLGILSNKIGKQWHCNNCKSDF